MAETGSGAVKRRPPWVDLLCYVSVGAVLVALSREGYLVWPRGLSPGPLLAAIAVLLAGFAASVMAWRRALRDGGIPVTPADALESLGLAVFGKYIPGKVWLILGMAGRIARRHDVVLREVVACATRMQVLSLWAGLILGAPALLLLSVEPLPVATAVALLLAGCAVLGFPPLRSALAGAWPWLGRVMAYVWPAGARLSVALALWLLLTWAAWGVGFALLVMSLSPAPPPWQLLCVFPLAGVLGILVLVAPGGIGAREGVLAALLVALGMDLQQVAGVSVLSRLWFLGGEATVFAAAALVATTKRERPGA